jgi:hypothetical protein
VAPDDDEGSDYRSQYKDGEWFREYKEDGEGLDGWLLCPICYSSQFVIRHGPSLRPWLVNSCDLESNL